MPVSRWLLHADHGMAPIWRSVTEGRRGSTRAGGALVTGATQSDGAEHATAHMLAIAMTTPLPADAPAPLQRPAKPTWPIDSQHTFWSLLRQVPYRSAAVSAFVIGCTLLLIYLVSIDYVPTDLLALLGLATLVSAWLVALWGTLTVLMFAPVFAVMLYGVRAPKFRLMLCGQSAASLVVMSWFLRDESAGHWVLSLGLAAAVVTLIWLIKEMPEPNVEKVTLTFAAMMLGGGALPLAVLAVALTGSAPTWPMRWWLLACFLLVAVLHVVNARAASLNAHPVAVWAASAFVTAVVFVVAAGWQSVPAALAERVGIRLPGTSTVIVPADSCKVIAVGVSMRDNASREALLASCDAAVSVVQAKVELRWSGRLLLAVEQINGMQVPKAAPRVTVPESGTQLVLPPHKP